MKFSEYSSSYLSLDPCANLWSYRKLNLPFIVGIVIQTELQYIFSLQLTKKMFAKIMGYLK